jgi:putative oxidoreductase
MTREFGKLVARAVVGLSFAAHGAQKAFGSFGGPGPEGAGAGFEGMGFKPGVRYAKLAAYTELASGMLIAIGLGGPAGASGILGVMTVAAAAVHAKNGFFASKGGLEINALYGAAALAIAMGGYGRLSLDALLGWDEVFADEKLVWAAVAAGPLGAALVLARREQPADVPPA